MNIPIFLASDNNYVPYMAATIVSIVVNTNSNIDFYILDGGIAENRIEQISQMAEKYKNCSLEFIKIDVEKIFSLMKDDNSGCPHVTLSTFNRFLIPDLKPNLKKVIYLDTDIIVKGDIKSLYEQDLGQYTLGAVPGQISTNPEQLDNRLGLTKANEYFNSGVLLMDLEKFRNQNIVEHLFEIEQEYREKIKYVDQDVLNIYFDNKYLKLDKIYNCETTWRNTSDNYIIRHFSTRLKPWFFSPNSNIGFLKHIDIFWEYLKKTPFYDEVYERAS